MNIEWQKKWDAYQIVAYDSLLKLRSLPEGKDKKEQMKIDNYICNILCDLSKERK